MHSLILKVNKNVLKFNIYCFKKRHCVCALLTAFNRMSFRNIITKMSKYLQSILWLYDWKFMNVLINLKSIIKYSYSLY